MNEDEIEYEKDAPEGPELADFLKMASAEGMIVIIAPDGMTVSDVLKTMRSPEPYKFMIIADAPPTALSKKGMLN